MDGQSLRIGLAGLGAIGRTHIKRINGKLRSAKVTGVTDMALEFGKKAAAELELPFYENAQALLDSGIDALIVTAADPDHEAYVLAAIQAGKPVFAKNRWLRKPALASASSTLKSRVSASWCRSALCGAMIQATGSSKVWLIAENSACL